MRLLNDIRHYGDLPRKHKLFLLAFLIALSGILSVLDTMIPKPLPMLKLGIANIVTLVLILEGRFFPAFIVAFFRTLISAVMIGTLLSYTFLLSLSGALVSVLFSVLFRIIFREKISVYGLSLTGAFFHTVGQGAVLALWFGWDMGILFLLSLFILFSSASGILIAFLADRFYQNKGGKKAHQTLR